ncbi:acetyl/propionyl/methylcrotonyl-CoA carboxylase subunit alpha [Hellea sp.]|nr:acetyl/propionyl/methylcrotonyl-CoA carboxylase subunit alpha [Hellea sp.]
MTKKIKKILIANRGEIACRVIKTARKMGIATVAVYSDADRKALHVRMADEAVHIGPSPAIESYLVIEKIIAAAKETASDAVHPGYGFLSENPAFVRACEKAKITFIGPSAESMEAMGLKDAAKKIMDDAGVPITPGYHGKDQDAKLLKAKAGEIGYPVLIKAVAGGGGKGMRKVEAEKDFDAMLASCQREAKSSFDNDDVLIEKYIQSPRHIEVQVFGDTHGNVVHMFERDCSLQRRHQKVIEEAPAPGMTDEVRKAMTDAAVKAAKAVDYVGAGTVEFIVDGSGKLRKDGFWFMEMNTRLQVEHPVTEMITGLDLVELQIRVAQGEKLPKQKDIKMEGHAVEARLYAEDPANDFLPSVGKVEEFRTEYNNASARYDSGIQTGDEISMYYDPMISKVIVGGFNRSFALDGFRQALEKLFLNGLKTNVGFLTRIAYSKDFIAAKLSTHFISENIDELTFPDFSENDDAYILAAAALYAEEKALNEDLWNQTLWNDFSSWRLNQEDRTFFGLGADGMNSVAIEIKDGYGQGYASIKGLKKSIIAAYTVSVTPSEFLAGNWDYDITDDKVELRQKGKIINVYRRPILSALDASSSNALTAPMPGKIIAVNAKAGDAVKAGDPLIIMEAMKMEMTLEAPRDGTVAEVSAAVDALVTDGEMLLSLEEIEKDK